MAGADLRLNPHLHIFGEIGTGQIAGRRRAAGANFQNAGTLQQLYVEGSGSIGTVEVGATLGRQEFADGPKQLISLGDGPNIHRTWNGASLHAQSGTLRVGAFSLRATRLGRGFFDEEINHAERLEGMTASSAMSSPGQDISSLDGFWLRTDNPGFRSGKNVGRDQRDTVGLRWWGRRGSLAFDWTIAGQRGDYMGRDTEAWAVFAAQSLALSDAGWKPRLSARIDVATGGGAHGNGKLRAFNQLYASSNYLGEGQFLSLSNLMMVAPGIALTPSARTRLSAEYGFARRLKDGEAAYAGGMRAYAGTQAVPGHDIGGLFRVVASWSVSEALTLQLNYERFSAGSVLKRAHLPSGGYAYIGLTYR